MNAENEGQGVGAVSDQAAGKPVAADGGSSADVRRQPKTIVGSVHGDKMSKTRTVRVQRRVKHPKYGKYVRKRTTLYAHDENEISSAGDTVLIAETRPLSKLKRWRVVKVLVKASGRRGDSADAPEGPASEGKEA